MWKQITSWAIVAIVLAVIAGAVGGEMGSKVAMRVANATIAVCLALLAVRAATRPKPRIPTLVGCGLFALGFGYLTYNVWPSERVYAVLGLVLDFL